MEIIKDIPLVKRWNLTLLDEVIENDILTEPERLESLTHAIDQAKHHYQYRHLQLGEKLQDIIAKISTMEWMKVIDAEVVLRNANSNKHHALWIEENRLKEKDEMQKKRDEIISSHTAKFIYNIMAHSSQHIFGKTLIVNESNKALITAICFFLSNDPRFETEVGLSFKKGLLIRGISGLGKTFLITCVKDNLLNPVVIHSMLDIAEKIKEEGAFNIRFKKDRIIYLDDVGTEESTINHFGTKINFFKNFLETFYMHHPQDFNRLIISTNSNFNEIEEKYGFRVRSRVKDMFNIIDIKGEDLRGKY